MMEVITGIMTEVRKGDIQTLDNVIPYFLGCPCNVKAEIKSQSCHCPIIKQIFFTTSSQLTHLQKGDRR